MTIIYRITHSVSSRRCGAAGCGSSRCSVSRCQSQCRSGRRRRRQLGPYISQLAVEPVLMRWSTGSGRRRPAPLRAEPCAGGRGRRRRDDSAVRAEVGGGTGTCRGQQAGVRNMNDVSMWHRVTLNLSYQYVIICYDDLHATRSAPSW